MCEAESIGIEELETIAIFGFDGQIPYGLKVHPDKNHIVFPLGNKVSILNLQTNKQTFLCGHTNTVSNIDVSKSGKLVASGQINHIGYRAYVIIWDWETKKEKTRYDIHKVRVEALCFSSTEEFLVTLGGRDDRMLIIWDIEKSVAICGSRATSETSGDATRVVCLRRRGAVFLTGGDQTLRLWSIDQQNKKLEAQDVLVGKLRREYTGMTVNTRDEIMYAGTMSGDVVKVCLNCHHNPAIIEREKNPVLLECFARHNPKKPKGKDCEKYVNGVRDVLILPNGNLIIGGGDGTVELVEERNMKFKDYPSPTWPQLTTLKRTKVNGAVSSIQLLGNESILIGTASCEIYILTLKTFTLKLVITCNTSTVYDIAFPHNFPYVFATASYQSIRIWSSTKMQELLRIIVPNFSAASIVFSHDGKSIVSGWNDGVIRAFTPLTGKLIYAIPNAHNKGCSAVTISSCGKILVSGGCEGQIRVWKIEPARQSLIGVLKEHSSLVGCVHFNRFDTEVVSASTDGTCIIWDIPRLSRKHVLYANTQFTCAKYLPSGVQILATGSDRRVSYWEVYDGSLVRDVEASGKGPVNSIAMSANGENFITAGHDQIIRLWDYQTGTPICAGYGHAAVIVSCQYSPCGKFLVSGSADGAVFMWKVPERYWFKKRLVDGEPRAKTLSKTSTPKTLTPKTLTPKALTPKTLTPKTITSKTSTPKLQIYRKPSSIRSSSEHIKELETSRSNKDVHICECPPVDLDCQPDYNEACVFEGVDNENECNSHTL